HEPHGLLLAGLCEKALTSPEHDREYNQPQLVDQVVLQQRAYKPDAAGDDNPPGYPLLQLRDLLHRIALQHRRVVPLGVLEGRRHDVLGQAVQPVRQGAAPGWPSRGEELVGPPAHQQALGAQRLVERGLADGGAVLDVAHPAAKPEALVTGRVLDDSVERDVLAHDDLSHFGSPFMALPGRPLPSRSRSSRRIMAPLLLRALPLPLHPASLPPFMKMRRPCARRMNGNAARSSRMTRRRSVK